VGRLRPRGRDLPAFSLTGGRPRGWGPRPRSAPTGRASPPAASGQPSRVRFSQLDSGRGTREMSMKGASARRSAPSRSMAASTQETSSWIRRRLRKPRRNRRWVPGGVRPHAGVAEGRGPLEVQAPGGRHRHAGAPPSHGRGEGGSAPARGGTGPCPTPEAVQVLRDNPDARTTSCTSPAESARLATQQLLPLTPRSRR
jgi:hypothetical protein